MKKTQGLRTLRDYRRTAKDSLFSIQIHPESKSTYPYDAIKTALIYSRNLICSSRINPPDPGTWSGTTHTGTKYEMIKPQLFKYIKLMEFTKRYHKVKSIDELFPNLRKRPDVEIIVFGSSGFTYLEAAFDFLLKFGRDIILSSLQDAYNKYRKENNIHGRFDLLGSTPEVIDKLKINPVTNIIIKTWFDSTVNKVKWRFEDFSDIKVEEIFNSTFMQIEHEWKQWKKPQKKDGQGNISGMRWQDAEKKAEAIVDKAGFQGFEKLRKSVGCHKRTLRKAINDSSKLKQAESDYKSTSSTLKAVGLTENILATYG